MTSVDIVFKFDGNEDIQDIASESDYHVTHSAITDTEVIECNEEDSTITVRCKISERVANDVVDNEVIPELDYGFYLDDKREKEYSAELIDYTIF
jgi:DNA-binding sugar fermentation-stimulating protein